jgi:hypothetical protein
MTKMPPMRERILAVVPVGHANRATAGEVLAQVDDVPFGYSRYNACRALQRMAQRGSIATG